MIVGIVGQKRVGKDTAAHYLCKRHGFEQDSFAAPLRRFACDVFGLDPDQLEEFKEKPCAWLDGKTPRTFLQLVGTEMGRTYHPEIWVRAAARRWRDALGPVVMSDVRFANEALAIVQRGGFVIRLHRDTGLPPDSHPSERALPDPLCDYHIDNNGSFDDLYAELDRILAERAAKQAA